MERREDMGAARRQPTAQERAVMETRMRIAKHAEATLELLGNDGGLFYATCMLEMIGSIASHDPTQPLPAPIERLRASAAAGHAAITGRAEQRIVLAGGLRV